MMRESKLLPGPTARLRLRRWAWPDKTAFRKLTADRRVMEYFPAPLCNAESDDWVDRIEAHHDRHGFGFWAVELRATSTFIGFTGLAIPDWDAPFSPCVEMGWYLARECWGQGYATEAARAALDFGFNELRLEEIVSCTASTNDRSRRVMQRLGMQRSENEDFYDEALPHTHPLAHHVLYRLSRETWKKTG